MLHRLEFEVPKVRTDVIPNRTATREFLVDRLKQRTSLLLRLVHQKREHHQHGEDDREIFDAMAKVVFELIALILQRVEGFVFNFPARTSTADKLGRVFFGNRQVGHPTKAFHAFAVRAVFRILQEVHSQIEIAFVERKIVRKTDLTGDPFSFRILPLNAGHAIFFVGLDDLSEEMFVISRFGTQQEVHPLLLEQTNMRSIAGQRIFHDDEFQVRMFFADLGE